MALLGDEARSPRGRWLIGASGAGNLGGLAPAVDVVPRGRVLAGRAVMVAATGAGERVRRPRPRARGVPLDARVPVVGRWVVVGRVAGRGRGLGAEVGTCLHEVDLGPDHGPEVVGPEVGELRGDCLPGVVRVVPVPVVRDVAVLREGALLEGVRPVPCHPVPGVVLDGGVLVAPRVVVEDHDVVPIAGVGGAVEGRVVADVVVVALGDDAPVDVPDDVVVDAGVPPRVGPAERAVHPDAVLRRVVDPVVGDLGVLLLPLHHLDDGPVGLQVGRVVDLVEHHLGRVPDADGGRCAGPVHRVVGEEVGRPAHGDRRHEARLVRARPVDVVEVGVVDLVADRGGDPTVRLEGGAVRVKELAGVDKAPYAVVDPADVPVVMVLVHDPEGPLRGAWVQEGGVPDLGPIAVVEAERRCEEVDPLDLDVVIVVARHPVGPSLDANVQVVRIIAPARHVVERVVSGLVVEVPLPVGVEQLELLGQEVHVVLVLPLVGGHLGVGEGALVGVEGEDLSAPRPERPDVQHGGRADWVDPAGHQSRVAGAAGGVVLQGPVQVLDAVPVVPAEVELLARWAPDVGIAIPVIVRVVDVGA